MYRIVAILALTLALVSLIGCGSASIPTAVPQPVAPAPAKPIVGRPRQVQKQITVMGKNGPEIVTVTETVTDDDQKMAVMPAEPIKPLPTTRMLPGGASPAQVGEKAPQPRAKQE